MSRDQSPVLPAIVQVRFAPYPCGGLGWGDIPSSFFLTTPLSKADLDLGDGVAGATHSIRDTCHAVYLTKGAPSNQGTLQSLVDQIGLDFWQWRSVAFDRVFNGVAVPVPDGLTDNVTSFYRVDRAVTRMVSHRLGSEPMVMGHSDPQNDCDTTPKVYGGGGSDVHASLNNGVLTLPKVRVYVEDGVLKWATLATDSLTLCPSTSDSSMAMTTEDGDSTMTAE